MAFSTSMIQLFILHYLFFHINSSMIKIKAKSIQKLFCNINVYRFDINVEIIQTLEEYKSFYLNVSYQEKDLLSKCIIDPYKSQIICIINLDQQKIYLKADDTIILPNNFPAIQDINWDYSSFSSIIFRKELIINKECDKKISKVYDVNSTNLELLMKIQKIYNGQCLISDSNDNYYTFVLNIKILGSNLESILASKTEIQISFLQNITMPFIEDNWKITSSDPNDYYRHKYYTSAFCYPLEDITNKNYQRESGFDLRCNIPLQEQYIFNCSLKIVFFY